MQDPDLTPTEHLVLEVLGARLRLGEQTWTFPASLKAALRRLAERDLVWWKSASIERAYLAGLTAEGKSVALDPDYTAGNERQDEARGAAGTVSYHSSAFSCGWEDGLLGATYRHDGDDEASYREGYLTGSAEASTNDRHPLGTDGTLAAVAPGSDTVIRLADGQKIRITAEDAQQLASIITRRAL